MRDARPMLGLALAALALIAVPLLQRANNAAKPTISDGPEALTAAAEAIDAFWANVFDREFPEAEAAYRSPRVVFDDVRDGGLAAEDDAAGYYVNLTETMHIDVNPRVSGRSTIMTIAHEYGHHVQNLAGWDRLRDRQEAFAGVETERRIGLRYELQAECLSGVWAAAAVSTGRILDAADIDRERRLYPLQGDSPTHGTAPQRLRWFDNGYRGGRAAACDTFSPAWDAL